MSTDGILNVIKPSGRTSFDVVSLVRQLSGERKVGHAGTLDPAATGVLLLCLGKGTRIVEFMAEATKVYRADIELGVTTDTYDASGKVTQRGDDSLVSRERVEEVLDCFRGTIAQIPPMYSATRYKGKHLYELARAGIEIARRPKSVHLSRLELIDWRPPVITVEVECSTGTYIRSLAYDIGLTLGCGAHLKSLVRLRCGCFDIMQAISLPVLEEAFHHGRWMSFLYPVDEVLLDWEAVIVNGENEAAIRHGRSLDLGQPGEPCCARRRCRAYSPVGRLLAVLTWQPEERRWHPDKVFSTQT